MSDAALPRIGPEPALLEVERQAFAALRTAQDRPSIENILRCADLWRAYQQRFRAAFPAKGGAR